MISIIQNIPTPERIIRDVNSGNKRNPLTTKSLILYEICLIYTISEKTEIQNHINNNKNIDEIKKSPFQKKYTNIISNINKNLNIKLN